MKLGPRTAAAAAAALALVTTGTAAARQPSPTDRLLLRQAAFDYYFTNSALSRADITSIRVAPLASAEPLRSRLVSKYATIVVKGRDASGQDIGYATAVAVYYSSPVSGWHVYQDGSSNVGCDDKWYPLGQRRTIIRSLGLTCTT